MSHSFRVIANLRFVVLKIYAKNMDICRTVFEDETIFMPGEELSFLAKTWMDQVESGICS